MANFPLPFFPFLSFFLCFPTFLFFLYIMFCKQRWRCTVHTVLLYYCTLYLLLMFLSSEKPVQSSSCELKAESQAGDTPTLLLYTNWVSRASSSSYWIRDSSWIMDICIFYVFPCHPNLARTYPKYQGWGAGAARSWLFLTPWSQSWSRSRFTKKQEPEPQ